MLLAYMYFYVMLDLLNKPDFLNTIISKHAVARRRACILLEQHDISLLYIMHSVGCRELLDVPFVSCRLSYENYFRYYMLICWLFKFLFESYLLYGVQISRSTYWFIYFLKKKNKLTYAKIRIKNSYK